MPQCAICLSPSFFLLNRKGYPLYRCSSCGLVFVFPQLELEQLTKIYSPESGYHQDIICDLTLSKPSLKTRQILSYLCRERKTGRVLDVGCSNGEFLFFAKRDGFETYGVEINKYTADIACQNGLRVFTGTLDEAAFSNDFFEIVYLGDLIEHVPDPLGLIKECRRILKPGGVIIISTPNLDCWWSNTTWHFFRWFKIPWSSVTPPYHLYQFNDKNLDFLMKGQSFASQDKWYNSPSLAYELEELHLLRRYKQSKKLTDWLFMVGAFSLYSITFVINYFIKFGYYKNFAMMAVYVRV